MWQTTIRTVHLLKVSSRDDRPTSTVHHHHRLEDADLAVQMRDLVFRYRTLSTVCMVLYLCEPESENLNFGSVIVAVKRDRAIDHVSFICFLLQVFFLKTRWRRRLDVGL